LTPGRGFGSGGEGGRGGGGVLPRDWFSTEK